MYWSDQLCISWEVGKYYENKKNTLKQEEINPIKYSYMIQPLVLDPFQLWEGIAP